MSKPKRIIFAVTNDLVTDQRVNRHIQSVLDSNVKVTLVGRKQKNSLDFKSNGFQTRRFRLLFNKGFLFYAAYNIRLFFYLLFRNVQLIVANDLDTLLACFLVSRLKGTELLYDSHELFTEVPELVNRPKTRKVWEKIEKWIFPKLKNVITVSESISEYYEEKYKVNVSVIRNLPLQKTNIESNEFPLPEKPFLIYQGALNANRGIELMIETMQYLADYQLLIVGDGDLSELLNRKVSELKLLDRIQFTGRINFQDVSFYTKKAVLGLSFEEDMGLNYRYALPNKMFDYIQANIPVLVSDLPEMKKIIQEFEIGEVLKIREPQKIAVQVKTIVEEKNKKYRTKLKEASTILCWEKEKEILFGIYKDMNFELNT